MLNKELLLTSSLNNSIQLPFMSGSGVDAYCYISFKNDSPNVAFYIHSETFNDALQIRPNDFQSSTKTAVPNTVIIPFINEILGRNVIPNNMYICGALMLPSDQYNINITSPQDGGFTWGGVYLPTTQIPFNIYLIGILSGQYQPVEGLTAMYITIE